MKKLCISLGLLLALSASAQNYSIDWYKVAGGGGTSTNASYAISGTIGQHDAGGPLIGGSYSLTSGFWSLFSVQTAGAPALTIFRTTTNTAVVSWPSPAAGWKLQQKADLSSGSWVTPAETVNDNGTNKFVIVSPPVGNRFYRLTSLWKLPLSVQEWARNLINTPMMPAQLFQQFHGCFNVLI